MNVTATEFEVVPFLGQVKTGIFSKEGPHTASQQLQDVIQTNVQAFWEFVEVSHIHILTQPGCIAGLLGARAATVVYRPGDFSALTAGGALLAITTTSIATKSGRLHRQTFLSVSRSIIFQAESFPDPGCVGATSDVRTRQTTPDGVSGMAVVGSLVMRPNP